MSGNTETRGQDRARWTALGWYYDKGGRRLGPFSSRDIQRQVAAGEIAPDEPAYVGWQRADEIRFLETDLRYALGATETAAPTNPDAPSEPRSSASTAPDK